MIWIEVESESSSSFVLVLVSVSFVLLCSIAHYLFFLLPFSSFTLPFPPFLTSHRPTFLPLFIPSYNFSSRFLTPQTSD